MSNSLLNPFQSTYPHQKQLYRNHSSLTAWSSLKCSLTNKYLAFDILINLLPFWYPWSFYFAPSSLYLVRLTFSFSPVFHIIFVVSHTCRCHPTSSFFRIPYHSWCPKRLYTWSRSLHSSYYTFQFSLISSSTVSHLLCADDTTFFISYIPTKKVFASHLWSTVNYFAYFILDVI